MFRGVVWHPFPRILFHALESLLPVPRTRLQRCHEGRSFVSNVLRIFMNVDLKRFSGSFRLSKVSDFS